MSRQVQVRIYKRLVRGYPRSFRDEYGEDLAATFALQLAELGPARCWVRATRDLLVTVPVQRLETHMKRPAHSSVALICGAFAIAGTALAIVAGPSPFAVVVLLGAVVAAVVAVRSRRSGRPAVVVAEGSSTWKRFLFTGGGLLAVLIVAMNIPANQDSELSEVGWLALMGFLLLSMALISAGVILAIARLSSRGRS